MFAKADVSRNSKPFRGTVAAATWFSHLAKTNFFEGIPLNRVELF